MDYEKKYNEALERARKIHDEIVNNEIIGFPEQITDIFPELRESEDERIRKDIRLVVESSATKYFKETGQMPEWYDRIVAYLEKQKEQKPAEKQDYSGLNDLERAILRGFLCAGVENVPVGIIKDTAAECMGFLALIEQKPAEWSEEEKDMVASIVAMCDDGLKDCVKGSTAYRVYNEIKDWINNLRPQPKTKWSEEDEKQLDDIISIIRGAYEHGITISETRHRNAYLWLNNLRPSWKPSEEQMEVLLNAEGLVRANNYNENAKILASLYEQLKKL